MTTIQKPLLKTSLVLIGLLAGYYLLPSIAACGQECTDMHAGTLAGTIYSPLRYRILTPWLVSLLEPLDTPIAYGVAHLVVMPILLLTLFAWLQRYLGQTFAFVGVLLLVIYLPLMYQVYGISLYTPVELLLLCAALLVRRPGLLIMGLVICGAFNRETTPILIIGGYIALNYDQLRARETRYWLWLFGYVIVSLAVYFGLRLVLGSAPDQVSVSQAWAGNTGGGWLTMTAVINNLFILPVWLFAMIGWRRAPAELKRLALVSIPYVGLLLIFAFWGEVRLLMPLWALVVPLTLRGIAAQLPVVNRLQR